MRKMVLAMSLMASAGIGFAKTPEIVNPPRPEKEYKWLLVFKYGHEQYGKVVHTIEYVYCDNYRIEKDKVNKLGIFLFIDGYLEHCFDDQGSMKCVRRLSEPIFLDDWEQPKIRDLIYVLKSRPPKPADYLYDSQVNGLQRKTEVILKHLPSKPEKPQKAKVVFTTEAQNKTANIQELPGPQEKKLKESVHKFLHQWLVNQNPNKAAKYWSELITDESLIPAGAYSVKEYYDKFPRDSFEQRVYPISSKNIRLLVAKYLRDSLGEGEYRWPGSRSIQDVLASLEDDLLDELFTEFIGKLNPRYFEDQKIIVYSVAKWKDFSWTASGTIGYRRIEEQIEKHKLDMRGVIFGIRHSGLNKTIPFFMLWADESANRIGKWKSWGLNFILTE